MLTFFFMIILQFPKNPSIEVLEHLYLRSFNFTEDSIYQFKEHTEYSDIKILTLERKKRNLETHALLYGKKHVMQQMLVILFILSLFVNFLRVNLPLSKLITKHFIKFIEIGLIP